MPLIKGCAYQNPIAGVLPAAPAALGVPHLAPAQGDHLFGDVLGTIETALQAIFDGGANWQNRMRGYSPTLAEIWAGLGTVDFGHGANPPVAQRAGAAEPDQHSHMFGGYSKRFQWQLCEIVCGGFAGGVAQRRVGGATHAWKVNVLASFDDLMNNLVDNTALVFYIAAPPGAIRAANPAVVNNVPNPAVVEHVPASLRVARVYANANHGPGSPGSARVVQVLRAYDHLRGSLEGILARLEETKTYDPVRNVWT